MLKDTRNNEEQFELLLMTLEDVRHGICLFQSAQQMKWVSLIKERLGQEKVIVHNIADDDENGGMVTSQDFRRWSAESDAEIVIICNVQLLGMRYGDKEVVEKLNFMRDQLLAIGKLFVLGVSPYFDMLLSRNARDLYSCILYHYIFRDAEERLVRLHGVEDADLSGDDVLGIKRYEELKGRILSDVREKDVYTCLNCLDSWLGIREHLSYQENEFILGIARELDEFYDEKDMGIEDVEPICLIAETWLQLEEREKSAVKYERARCFVKEQLGVEHEKYADVLKEYAGYYEAVSEFSNCENCCNQALEIYERKGLKYSDKARQVLCRKAILYRRKMKYDLAMNIYEDLLHYESSKYGEKYYWNAFLYNNIGRVYEEKGDVANALVHYEKALGVLENAGKHGGWTWQLYHNIAIIYVKSGDANQAWRYVKEAKRIVDDVYGNDSAQLIDIYNSMSSVWHLRERYDRQEEYLQKALELIEKKSMESTEVAAFVNYNMGCMLFEMGDCVNSMYFLKNSLRIREKMLGEENDLTASCYEMLGYVFYQMEDYANGKKHIDKARGIFEILYGKENEYTKRMEDFLLQIVKE